MLPQPSSAVSLQRCRPCRIRSSIFSRHTLLLSFLIALLITLSTCNAGSVWSYFSSDEAANDDNSSHDVLVSPIVNREIQVSVKAPWPSSSQHSVLCEAFCFLRDYAFLDALATFQGRDHLVTYQRATQYALELAQQSGAVQDTSLLKVALTMRAMAPTCELHRSIVQDQYAAYAEYLEAFVVVAQGGMEEKPSILETSTDLPESILDLPVLTQQERKGWLLPNEVIRKGSKTIVVKEDDSDAENDDETCSSMGLVILYARLGGHSFATFYRRLVELEIPFVVRHMGGDPEEDNEQPETVLQGYGVRLDIRNVEYKVFDDKKDVDETTQSAMINLTSLDGNFTGDESGTNQGQLITSHFLAGVNLTALPLDAELPSVLELQRKMWTLHEHYEAQSGLIPPNWQRRKLSLQAATVIAQSNNPLLTLQDVSQNLPSVASTLVHTKVSEDIEMVAEPMERNLHRMIRSSGGGLWINGRIMNVERPSFNVFEMIKLLKEEYNEMSRLERELKPLLKEDTAMVGLEAIHRAWIEGAIGKDLDDEEEESPGEDDEDSGAGGKGKYRIDLATGDEGSVIYMNDLEKDKGYARLPSSVQQMLMAMQYGMPPSVRRNLFTILAVDDPIDHKEASQNLGESLMGQLAQQQFPARLAIVVAGKEDIEACSQWLRSGDATSLDDCPLEETSWLKQDDPPREEELKSMKATARDFHRLYAFMRQEYSDMSEVLIAYKLYFGPSLRRNPPANGEFYSLFDVFTMHNELLVGLQIVSTKTPIVEIARSLQENEEDSNYKYSKAVRFAVDKGIKPGMSFVNGRPLPTDADDAEHIQTIFSEEQQMIFGMVVEQKLTDTTPRNFYYKLIKGKKKNVFPRLHPLLTTGSSDDFVEISHEFGDKSLLSPSNKEEVQVSERNALFLYEAILDLDTFDGLKYAKEFLNIMESASKTLFDDIGIAARYRILPSTAKAAKSPLCSVFSRAAEYGFEKIFKTVDNLLSDPEATIDPEMAIAGDSMCSESTYLQQELPSKNFITANGRVYSMNGEPLDPVDIELLTTMNMDSTKFATALLRAHVDETRAFDAVSRTTAFLMTSKSATKKRSDPTGLLSTLEDHFDIDQNPLRFSWNAESESRRNLKMRVTAIVDPVTETAQRLSTLLVVIRDELKLPLTLVLAPTTQLDGDSDIPISSYYRFVADPSSYQGLEGSPHAHFSNLPTGHVLTLRMDVPEPWDVQQTAAIQDTDNLRCDLHAGCGDENQSDESVLRQKHVTKVEYGLEHLLFFGQCYDTKLSPPNGLQLVLSKPENIGASKVGRTKTVEVEADGSVHIEDSGDSFGEPVHYSDTLVMKTVGYWQLRANPGVWNLQINEKSRGAEIFQMVDGKVKHGMLRIHGNVPNNKKRLVMGDFAGDGRGEMLLVKRKPGYEKASLFYDDKKDTGDDDVVHVFSLATGHLYERFLKIMMLSVTKRTSTKVKFWLFENFLSPTFKASSMAMAKRIGCEVEFVTYKWPEWLRGQSEKQRIIWGYKILFLDVLFPLDVKKIIYVDSDQVVRGNLKELWDMDLQGAPYGYTPMCSSNEATLGFQFWRQGFWESHLRGKPYHISALYVVDLEKFRKDRVGDTLRSQYQALSADPGSLANLDQDLPNYAQHQVPIFSLPQEWLWCESWCSNETKADAKTIDLCNNPLHKEPKVSMAKRIISGELFEESWIELDAEVERYEKEYLAEISAS